MSKKYRRAIFSRTPVVNRKPVKHDRVPVRRHSIFNRIPVTYDETEVTGCSLFDSSCSSCATENQYCEWNADPEKYDFQVFRLIRVCEELTEETVQELIKKIQFVKSLRCYVRLITDVPLENEILFTLGYDALNVVQYNINILESSKDYLSRMKRSIFTADNCGLYVGLMVYPIIPGVTKSYDVLELLNSFRCSCNNIAFRYLELPSTIKTFTEEEHTYFNVNGYVVSAEYYKNIGNKWVVNTYYRRTFSTIMTRFLTPRKVNCSCCNDYICY